MNLLKLKFESLYSIHFKLVLKILILLLSPNVFGGDYDNHPEAIKWLDNMVKVHKLDRKTVAGWLSNAQKQDKILELVSRPAEKVKTWEEYRAIFINKSRVLAGKNFYNEHKEVLDDIYDKYGVPGEVIVAIMGVETFYNSIRLPYRAIDALATLSFDYPPRSRFFKEELTNFMIMLAKNRNLEITELNSSYAGALGIPQFMPSNYLTLAVSYSEDSKYVDIWSNPNDAIASIANYLVHHKWKKGLPYLLPASYNPSFSYLDESKSLLEASKWSNSIEEQKEYNHWYKQGLFYSSSAKNLFEVQKIKSNKPNLKREPKSPISRQEGVSAILLERDIDGTIFNEYWLGTANLESIYRYNPSTYYTMVVALLAHAIANDTPIGKSVNKELGII